MTDLLRRPTPLLSLRSIAACVVVAAACVPVAAAAGADIDQGKIFGIKIGERLVLSAEEQRQAAQDNSGSFIRHPTEKPDDIIALQVYATPITRTVTAVDGLAEFKTEKAATAFTNKYVKLLPAISPNFKPLAGVHSSDPETKLLLVSKDWSLSVTQHDLRVNKMGFHVRITLRPSYDNPMNRQLMKLEAQEKQALDAQAAAAAVSKGRKDGSLRGL